MPLPESAPPDIDRLAQAGDTEGLVSALAFGDHRVREKAEKALAEKGKEVVPLILRRFTPRENSLIRDGVGSVIRRIGRDAYPPLAAALKHKEDKIRAAAAMALGYLGKPAVPVLVKTLDDPSRDVRARAAESLARAGWTPSPEENRERVLYFLVRGEPEELVRTKKSAFPVLVKFLESPDRHIRIDAIRALGKIGSVKVVPLLVRLLEDPESEVRSGSAEALGEIGDQGAIPRLVRTLADSSLNVRMETVWALEKMGWQPKTGPEKVRYFIAKEQWEALAGVGPDGIPPLVAALADENAHVRTRISGILAGLGKNAVPALEQAANGPDAALAARAGEVLSRIREGTGTGSTGKPGPGGDDVGWLLEPQGEPSGDSGDTSGEKAPVREDEPESPLQKVARIAPALRDPDPVIRTAAVEALRVVGIAAERTLIRTLKDPQKNVRAAATEALGSMQASHAVPYLIRLLARDPERDVRQAAADALGRIRDSFAVPYLIRAFRDRDPLVRAAAATAAGRIGSTSREPVLAAAGSQNPVVRYYALQSLGEMQDPEVLPHIVQGLDDRTPDVVQSAKLALAAFAADSSDLFLDASPGLLVRGTPAGRTGILETAGGIDDDRAIWILRALVQDPDEGLRARARTLLAAKEAEREKRRKPVSLSGEEEAAVRSLIETLGGKYVAARRRAAEQLKTIGSQAARLLLAAYDTADPQAEKSLDGILYSMREPAMDEIIGAVRDPSPRVRGAAVRNLGHIPQEKAVKALGWVIFSEEDPVVRRIAAESLGNQGSPLGIRPLIHCLNGEPGVKRAAIASLGKIGTAEAAQALIGKLAGVDEETADGIAMALAGFPEEARPALFAALREGTPEFRETVARTLDRLGWTPQDIQDKIRYFVAKGEFRELNSLGLPALGFLVSALDDDEEKNREEIARVIGLFGEQAFNPLSIALAGERPSVREGAALAFGYLGDIARTPLLKAIRDPDPGVRLAAARSLDRTGWTPQTPAQNVIYTLAKQDWPAAASLGKGAVPPLVRLLNGTDIPVQEGAIRALGEIRDPRAVPYLVKLAETTGDTRVTRAVIRALGTLGDKRTLGFLRKGLEHQEFPVRAESAAALVKMGWTPATDRDSVLYAIAQESPVRIARMGDAAIPSLLEALLDDEVMVRLVVTEALAILGEPALAALKAAVQGKNQRLRDEAASVLSVLQTEDRTDEWNEGTSPQEAGHRFPAMSDEEIRAGLADPDESIRVATVHSLIARGPSASGTLQDLLRKESDAVRAAAISALGRIGDGSAAAAILRCLEDPDEEIRRAAAEALGNLRDPLSLSPLLGRLTDPSARVRAEAARAAGRLGTPALLPLLDASESPDPGVRSAALEGLGALQGRTVLHPLIKSLTDPDNGVRETGAGVLARLAGNPRLSLMGVLGDLLTEGDTELRLAVLGTLARIRTEPATALIRGLLYDNDPAIRKRAEEVLQEIDRAGTGVSPEEAASPAEGEDVPALIQALASPDAAVRDTSREKLLAGGNGAVPALFAALSDAGPDLYREILAVLQETGDPILEDCLAALENESVKVRLGAVILAGSLARGRTVPALGRVLYSEPSPEVRIRIAESLGRLGDDRGVKPLIDALPDRNPGVRVAVIRALGLLRDERAVGPLIRELAGSDEEIVYAAAEAFLQMGETGRPELVRALRSGDHPLKARIARILQDIQSVPRDPVEKAYFLIGLERWYDLEAIGAPALRPLAECLTDPSIHIRLGAVNAIQKIGGGDAVPPLVTALNDPSPIVRNRAESALITLGRVAKEPLEEALTNGILRSPETARKILQKIPPVPPQPVPDESGEGGPEPPEEP